MYRLFFQQIKDALSYLIGTTVSLAYTGRMRCACPQQQRSFGLALLPPVTAPKTATYCRLTACNVPRVVSLGFSASRADQTSTNSSTENGVDYKRVATAAAVTAVTFTLVSGVRPASAKELIWKPRRHHRHIGERFGDSWAAEVVMVSNSLRQIQTGKLGNRRILKTS